MSTSARSTRSASPTPAPATDLSPSATFYASTTYGRDVYNVLPTAKVGGLAGCQPDVKTLFVGNTSAICQATTTINNFGFASRRRGLRSITLQGPLVA